MKILILSRCSPYPLHLGDRLILYHLAEQLSARSYQIDLLAFFSDPRDPQDLPKFERLFRSVKFIPEPRRTGLDYLRRLLSGKNRFFPTQRDQAWSPQMWDMTISQLKANKYDLVLLFGGIHVYEYRELLRGLPTVIVPYESYSLFLRRALALEQGRGNWGRVASLRVQLSITRRYERAMFAGFDRVVVLTDQDKEALYKLKPDLPIDVIPNGIDTDYFKPASAEVSGLSDLSLLFFGNFEYPPNVDAALWLAREIFPLVRVKYPQTRLLLVGNAPTQAMLALAGKNIEVTGRVPDVRPYLTRAQVFISPLRLGAGIKNKVLEAMAMGKPIVATRLSCDGIGLEPGQHVLYGESAVELAADVAQLFTDHDLRGQMALANRERIEQGYTWTSIADRYIALFDEITHHPR